jgi:hypothetical protein
LFILLCFVYCCFFFYLFVSFFFSFSILHNYLFFPNLTLLSSQKTTEKKIMHLNFLFNPFTAEVAIMRLLDSAPKSHLCDQRKRSKVTGLSDQMTLFIDLECVYCKQTQRAFNVFKKHAKLIENWFSRSKVQLTRVWELFTRRWNVWHWESHCVFTAGGERVKVIINNYRYQWNHKIMFTNKHYQWHTSLL